MTEPRYLEAKAARRCVQCARRARAGIVRCGHCVGFVGVSRVAYERISIAAMDRGITRTRLVELALAGLPEAT